MAAAYPFQYKQFTTHRNLLDDVDASHVNDLQFEIAAIEQTLGLNPAADSSLKMRTNSWASVGARMSAIQRGAGVPAIYLGKSTDSYKGGGSAKNIAWPAPRSYYDPEGLFNGSAITTNRSGWWIVTTAAIWTGGTGAYQTKDRQISIELNGLTISSQDGIPTYDGNTHMSLTWMGPVTAGVKINFQVYHPMVGVWQGLSDLSMSAAMIREM
jgi:hypothetical protein